MSQNPYLYITIILSLAFNLKQSKLNAQKLMIDTSTYSQYGVYCEGVQVCEYLVPDSVFQKLNGKPPDEEVNGRLKYKKYCYNLGYNSSGELFSFKDFSLFIGNNGFEFSYPQYSYYLSKKTFNKLLNNISLYSHKTNESYDFESISVYIESDVEQKFILPKDHLKLAEVLKHSTTKNIHLRLKLAPINYPKSNEKCGTVITHFPAMAFTLY